ncbi:hypothetical protein AAZX31_01G206600 [Glycine max]
MRYGFVKFIEVEDSKRLERQVDNIFIGSLKLYVNLPRFQRSRGFEEQREVQGQRNHYEEGASQRNKSTQGYEYRYPYSYAQIVSKKGPGGVRWIKIQGKERDDGRSSQDLK